MDLDGLSQASSTRGPAPGGRAPLVLVVDDSRAIRDFMKNHLASAGYAVVSAGNGKEALAVMSERRVDMVISDIHMPVMDGKAFRAKLLEIPEFAPIPFVAMSTDDSLENARSMRELRAAAFLTKPFKADQMIILVESILDYRDLLERTLQEMEGLEKRMLLSSIMSLAHALDARDHYTSSHSENVAHTAVKIVSHMGHDAALVEMANTAGRLHDIGKVGIPDNVLQKPGRLTVEEFEVIKTHPGIGAMILKPIPSLAEVADIIHCHHEHFDGSGYPRGLAGGDIPFLARVLALADVFDALTSDRPYRSGMDLEKALGIMKDGRGSHFCPQCLDAFLDTV
ncbi:MAG: response regulator [Proteobacteria bacterium]|nr:response regulator [Pseudomonadota bacterium]MBU1593996.1 response regulator [Pseudomonadota bacterium]